ncbi:MAG: hypothetical protein GY749_43435 [Desulfobacteraceae bacterium]|nr:hypothetical protein [Desulfobacteraceae bacterium]
MKKESEKEFQKKLKRISMNGTLKSGTSPGLLKNSDVHLTFKDLLSSLKGMKVVLIGGLALEVYIGKDVRGTADVDILIHSQKKLESIVNQTKRRFEFSSSKLRHKKTGVEIDIVYPRYPLNINKKLVDEVLKEQNLEHHQFFGLDYYVPKAEFLIALKLPRILRARKLKDIFDEEAEQDKADIINLFKKQKPGIDKFDNIKKLLSKDESKILNEYLLHYEKSQKK